MRPQSLSWKCVIPARDLARRKSRSRGRQRGRIVRETRGSPLPAFPEPEGADKLAALAEEALPVFHAAGDVTVANSASQRVVVLTT